MGDWLVPLSCYVRCTRATGREIPTSFDQLQAAGLFGQLATVVCDLRGALVDIHAGDRVWFYTGELEAGVFAVGRVQRPTKTNNPTVTVTVDKSRTRLLAGDPLPSVTIRRWLPELKVGAMALDSRPRALGVLEAWEQERADRDVELLTPIGAIPWRAAIKPNMRTFVARDEVLGPIARLLRSQEFAVGVVKNDRADPWLIGRRVRDVVVVDVERVRAGRGRNEALAALGPLREFRWRLDRTASELRLRLSTWIAFTARPNEQAVAFLEDEDILASWQQRAGVTVLTDRSKQRWYQYLGVR